jgi:hypothetical protein
MRLSAITTGTEGRIATVFIIVHDGHRPYWKRAHRDWRFWAGVSFMFAAIVIYAIIDDLA